MSDTTRYAIGAEVRCRDGLCGRLNRVVIDPVARTLTHLVVEPTDGHDTKRLVPIELADAASDGQDIRLRCGEADFREFEPAEVTEFLPAIGDQLGYTPGQMIAWPYYGLGMGAMGMGSPGLLPSPGSKPRTTTYDRVPKGEIQIRRGQPVEAPDGDVGRVKGLVIEPQEHGVTHVLLEEGHLWGKKVVAIPIREVTCVGGGIRVELTKKELNDLPPVDFDEHG